MNTEDIVQIREVKTTRYAEQISTSRYFRCFLIWSEAKKDYVQTNVGQYKGLVGRLAKMGRFRPAAMLVVLRTPRLRPSKAMLVAAETDDPEDFWHGYDHAGTTKQAVNEAEEFWGEMTNADILEALNFTL